MKDNKSEIRKLTIPRFPGANTTDYVLCAIARCYPDDIYKDGVAKGADVSLASVYYTAKRMVKSGVLQETARNRYKLVNLDNYIQQCNGVTAVRRLLKKLDIKLPPDVLSPEGIKTPAPVVVNNIQPTNEMPLLKRGMSEAEGRLKDYVTEFLGGFRSQLDRFEAGLNSQNY